jgi:acetyl esterase
LRWRVRLGHEFYPADLEPELGYLQSGPIGKSGASIEDATFPVGPNGAVGGVLVAGGVDTDDRLIREIAVAVSAAVVFVAFGRAPEIQFSVALEEAYAATTYVANYGDSLNLEGARLAVVGDAAGGNGISHDFVMMNALADSQLRSVRP